MERSYTQSHLQNSRLWKKILFTACLSFSGAHRAACLVSRPRISIGIDNVRAPLANLGSKSVPIDYGGMKIHHEPTRLSHLVMKIGDPLQTPLLVAKRDELPEIELMKKIVAFSQREMTVIEEWVKTAESGTLTVDQAELVLARMKMHDQLIETIRYERIYFKRKAGQYMKEVFRAKAVLEVSFAKDDTLEHSLMRTLVEEISPGKNSQLTVLRVLMMARLLQSQDENSFKNVNSGIISSLRKLLHLESCKSFCKISTFRAKAVIVTLFEKVLAGYELTLEEQELLDSLGHKRIHLRPEQEQLVQRCVSTYLTHHIPQDTLARKKSIWKRVIANVKLDLQEERDLYLLKSLEMKDQIKTLEQLRNRETLKNRNTLFFQMRENVARLENIEDKLAFVVQLTPEDQAFLNKHFVNELKSMRHQFDFPPQGVLPASSAPRMDQFTLRLNQHRGNTEIISAMEAELYLGEVLTLDELSVLRATQDSRIQHASLETSISSSVLQYPQHTAAGMMQQRGVKVLEDLLSQFHISKTLFELKEKMADHSLTSPHIEKNLRKYMQPLVAHEKFRLMTMSFKDKAKAMLEIKSRCHLYPISAGEKNLLKKLDASAERNTHEEDLLHEAVSQFQLTVMSCISEYDLALSYLLWLDEHGDEASYHGKLISELKENSETLMKLKYLLRNIAYSPLERYVLFKATEHLMMQTLETKIARQLRFKREDLGFISHFDRQLQSFIGKPNWQRLPLTEDQMEVLENIYHKDRHWQEVPQSIEKTYHQIVNEHNIQDMGESTTTGELQKLIVLVEEVASEEQTSIQAQKQKHEVLQILKNIEKRYKISKEFETTKEILLFNKLKIDYEVTHLEKYIKDFLINKSEAERHASSLYQFCKKVSVSMLCVFLILVIGTYVSSRLNGYPML